MKQTHLTSFGIAVLVYAGVFRSPTVFGGQGAVVWLASCFGVFAVSTMVQARARARSALMTITVTRTYLSIAQQIRKSLWLNQDNHASSHLAPPRNV